MARIEVNGDDEIKSVDCLPPLFAQVYRNKFRFVTFVKIHGAVCVCATAMSTAR